jgi:membrane protease YdiL (CAAX protease family)
LASSENTAPPSDLSENAEGGKSIAPAWHTAVLLAGIALLSFGGAKELSGPHAAINRIETYALTGITDVLMFAWVWFGLRLRRVSIRSILGENHGGFKTVAMDLGIALVFWMGALFVLGSLGLIWTAADAAIHHRPIIPSGKGMTPDATEQHTVQTLTALAPETAKEVAAWILLCMMAGFTEEVVFRGYLQTQFTAWGHGAAWAGVVFSALMFGAGHAYQGARNMVLLAVFGVLFSLLAIYRRSLRAGIFAHVWQDMFAGLMLALLRSWHRI